MAKKKTLKNDDIDEKKRLELYNSQYLIRVAEQRAYDLFQIGRASCRERV